MAASPDEGTMRLEGAWRARTMVRAGRICLLSTFFAGMLGGCFPPQDITESGGSCSDPDPGASQPPRSEDPNLDCSDVVAAQIEKNPLAEGIFGLSGLPFVYPSCAGEFERVTIPDTDPSWKLTARAQSIVIGSLSVDDDAIGEALAAGGAYVNVLLTDVDVLKGCVAQPQVAFSVYIRPESEAEDIPATPAPDPSAEELSARNGQRTIAFLIGDDPSGGSRYLAGMPRAASLVDATPEIIEGVVAIVAQHKAWLSEESLPNQPLTEIDIKVQHLMDCMVADRVAQLASFQELRSLGPPAVGSLIRHLDDRRTLADDYIAVCNCSPDAFELFAQYSPDTVLDATAMILRGLTGERFWGISNRGVSVVRDHILRGWRIYEHHLRDAESTHGWTTEVLDCG